MYELLKKFKWELLFSFLSVIFFIATSGYFMDDSFISFTYSNNLVNVGSISYNGIRVEGYSSFIHVLVGSVLLLFGKNFFPLVLKIYSSIFLVIFVFLSGTVIRKISKENLNVILGLGIISLSPVLIFQFQSGMETPLVFLQSLVVINVLINNYKNSIENYFHWIMVLVFLGMLIRPEFIVFCLPIFLYFGFTNKQDIREVIARINWKIIFLLLAIGIFYILFKLTHFGDIFPNPYYVKHKIAPTGEFYFVFKVLDFILLNPYILGFFILLLFYFKRFWKIFIVSGSLFVYLVPYIGTNFWQDHYFRYFSPLIPIFAIMFYGVVNKKLFGNRSKYFLICVTFFSILAHIFVLPNMVAYTKLSAKNINIRKNIGISLSDLKYGKVLISCGDAGIIAFYAFQKNIDYYFLNSKLLTKNRISQNKAYWGLNTNLLFSQNIDVFILASADEKDFFPGFGGNRGLAYEISRNPKFTNYLRVAVFDASTEFSPFALRKSLQNYKAVYNPYFYHIFVNKKKPELIKELSERFKTNFF